MSNSKPAFEVIDRRGQARIETPEPLVIEKDEKATMTGVGYMLVFLGSPQGPIPAVRAAGTRSNDKQTFVADYLLPIVLPSNLDLFKEVNRRLESFLHCGCTMAGHCGVHQMYLKQWVEADMQRLTLAAAQPVSDALEVLLRRENEKQPKIIVPR